MADSMIEKRGRKPVTGRFDTRAELCKHVWNGYQNTMASIADIARQCRVSATIVSRIISTREGMPARVIADVPVPARGGEIRKFGTLKSMSIWLGDVANLVALGADYPAEQFGIEIDTKNLRIHASPKLRTTP